MATFLALLAAGLVAGTAFAETMPAPEAAGRSGLGDLGDLAAELLPADDECSAGPGMAGDCALAALQLRGQRAPVETITTEDGTSVPVSATPGPIVQAKKLPGSGALHVAAAKNKPGVEVPNGSGKGEWFGGGTVSGLAGQTQVDLMALREKDWKMGGIVYQVFVDRFVQPKNLSRAREYLKPPRRVREWTDPIEGGGQDAETKYYAPELDFYGGDLQGLISKLDYVRSWGDILYLQPIFEAFSVHKYDTTDYLKIDPLYGNVEDFDTLVAAVHGRGMKLVLDGVFNHMGVRSPIFQEALKNPLSNHRHWFFIGPQYGPTGYKAWQNGGTLSELRLEEPTLQQYIWGADDSVAATWLHRGADGWRLDVATEIGREYLWDLTKSAHAHKFGSLVVGEVSAYPRWWTEAMDGVLSFWMGWIINGVTHGDLTGNIASMQIDRLIRETSMEQLLRSWVIVSNHDTERLMDKYPTPYQREFARTLQFVLPGTPCIYYGEELGMKSHDEKGKGDPFNRAPMAWDKISDDNEAMTHTRFLVDLRRKKRALRIGDFYPLMAISLCAFLRRTDRIDELVIIAANQKEFPIEEILSLQVEDVLEYTPFRDVATGEMVRVHGGTIQLKIPPHTVSIYEMANDDGPASQQYKRIYGHWDTFPDVDAGRGGLGNSVGELIISSPKA